MTNFLGFTGTRATEERIPDLLRYVAKPDMRIYLDSFDGYVTGGCRGWDAFIGAHLVLAFPEKTHLVVVPANRSQVDPWWETFDLDRVLVVYMEDGTDYRDRNTEIVRRSNAVFYCADYPEQHPKSKRSGTWMTKRIAEGLDVPVTGIILNTSETT